MKKTFILFFSFISFIVNAQLSTHQCNFEGKVRAFNLYIPTSYNANTDTLPIVFFLHGMGGDMSNFTGLTYKAEAEKFIMIIPQAIADPLTGSTWHSGAGINSGGITYYPNATINDVGFLSSLIDSVSTWYNVDDKRIYSTGFSMGAFMTNRLACELGNRIAAIASVAGTIGNEIVNDCNPEYIIPVLHIHSTSDQTVPYTNNTFGNDAEDMIEFWIGNNHCNETPDSVVLTTNANDGFQTIRYTYTDGDLGSKVILYKLIGPDHNTSWFTATSGNDFDAIEVIWDFFEQFEKLSNPETPNAIKIAPNLKNVRFDIFPNPATDKISLSFNNKVAISSIAISNTLGKTLETKIFDKPITKSEFNISDKSPGIYFFQISDTEGNLTVLRFYKK